jgi:hypothetical protein
MDTATQEGRLIVGYRRLAEFLTNEGYPIGYSTVQKYCSPAIGIGPPIHSYWGRLPAFKPDLAITWAKSRLRPVTPVNTSRGT